MLDFHSEKTRTSTPEDSRRLKKACPKTWGPPTIGQGRAPRGAGVAARRPWPITASLMDPASTDFKD